MSSTRPDLSWARHVLRPVAIATVMLGAVSNGCHHETGPSLSFVVDSQALAPSSSLPNASSLCCCRVKGTVRNTSTIALHINLNFQGFDTSGALLGTAIDFVSNVPPGGKADFDAAGILAPCSRVVKLSGQHLVTGVYTGAGS
jgi:hypothetical protein